MARGSFRNLMYNEILSTPGYEQVFAIGTTYSLSLEALITVPISFGMLGELDDNIRQSPVCILEAVRRCADKFVIFCNKGSISVPSEIRKVYSLLEKSIIEVSDKNNHFSNFHPKLWVVKERNSEDLTEQIKIIVLSRNLTFDNSIDIACTLTGRITRTTVNNIKHKPLTDMLLKLSDYTEGHNKEKIKEVIEDISKIDHFNVDNDLYEEYGYEFIPLWFGSCLNNEVHLPKDIKGNTTIIVSPFIDSKTLSAIKSVRQGYKPDVLITRRNFVSKSVVDMYKDSGNIYCVNETMLDNSVTGIDLHAKMYWVLKSDGKRYLYLGSANATESAFNRNTEFLLRLQYKQGKKYLYEDFLDNFKNDDRMFEEVTVPYQTQVNNRYTEAEKIMKHFINLDLSAVVEVNGNVANVTLHIPCMERHDSKIVISPLQTDYIEKAAEGDVCFENIPVHKLSEFYIVKVLCAGESKSVIIKINTLGIPGNRDEMVVRSIIDTRKKFIDYITFMISSSPTETIQNIISNEIGNKGSSKSVPDEPRIYEQMLRMAYDNPAQLREIDKTIKMLDSKVVSPKFRNMYRNFISIINSLERL